MYITGTRNYFRMIWRISVRDLKLIVDILRDILMQIWIEFNADGTIQFCAVDPEKVASIRMCLEPSAQEYKCTETIRFSLYLQSLFKILRGAAKNEVAVLTCFRENPDQLVVRITGNDAQCFVVHRIKEEQPQYEELSWTYGFHKMAMNADDFYTMIRDLGAVGKLLEVSVNDEGRAIFQTKDALGTSAEYITLEPVSENRKAVKSQTYIMRYIEKFCKPGLADNIAIFIGPSSPIRFVWNMDYGYLALNVAPLPGKASP